MTSIITQFLNTLFPKKEARLLFIGLDAAGKTTILYKLKLGEVVSTIPTIGFNVETVPFQGMDLTIWDVGGCDKIRPLWRHYHANTQGLIFVVDANDHDRLLKTGSDWSFGSAEGLFIETLRSDELRGVKVLIYLNKQDLPNALTTAQFLERFKIDQMIQEGTIPPFDYHVQPVIAPTGEGLYEGLAWLVGALRDQNQKKKEGGEPPAPPAAEVKTAPPPSKEEELMMDWLARVDDPDDLFLEKLQNYTLDSWDHYTHLRIAWLYLQQYGRREGMKRIFSSIKAFIENSPRTKSTAKLASGEAAKRGTTFHETMTYFWVHMVDYAMAATKLPEKTFKVFLFMNPQLTNGGLFLHYYSKKLMLHEAKSRSEVVLPDLKPLPSILPSSSPSITTSNTTSTSSTTTTSITTALKTVSLASQSTANLSTVSDESFYQMFKEGRLPSFGHEVKVRLIYLSLCLVGRGKGGIDQILAAMGTMEKEYAHLTINYFWIQMVSYHIMQLIVSGGGRSKWKKEAFGKMFPPTASSEAGTAVVKEVDWKDLIPFHQFLEESSCGELKDPLLYDRYYSRELLDREEAKQSFQLPDRKPLPNILMK